VKHAGRTHVAPKPGEHPYTHYENGLIRERIKDGTDQRLHVYDPLNRLLATFDGPLGEFNESVLHDYDHLGNMTQRGGSTLTYNAAKPHLLENVDTNAYLYDLNGNVQQRQGPQIPGGIQNIAYTPFDLPKTVLTGLGQGTKTTKFEYSADEERLVRRDTGPGINRTRHFVTDLYQRLTDNIAGATLEERFRIYAGSREVAQVVRENGVDKTLFFHADHLGTPETITTSDGDVAHQDLDPWGRESSSGSTELTRVGFTGHEHDRDLGLIDMKGRVYDPLAARFTSADPIMQAPFWSQGLNRYAYTFNDPVNHTDPSGFQVDLEVLFESGETFYEFADDPLSATASSATSSGAAASTGAGSTGASAPFTGAEAAGSGAPLGSVLGMTGSVLNTVRKALEGGYLGQNSTPSNKEAAASGRGGETATARVRLMERILELQR
jgi:RHS repeat-associated protein